MGVDQKDAFMKTKEDNLIVADLQIDEEKPLVINEEKTTELVTNEKLAATLEKALDNVQDDRKEISDILEKFLDMVLNDGDATSATKEAVVNLVKAKSEVNDQVIKLAELMTRLKLKERTVLDPAQNRAIHAQQNNIYLNKADDENNILLQEIEKASARIKKR